MFTGLIDGVGRFIRDYEGRFFFSLPENYSRQLEVGGSIGINGVCLTLVEIKGKQGRFSTDVSRETKEKTNLGNLEPGDKVNLELPLETSGLAGRLDGHLVQGHIDTTGKISKITYRQGDHILRVSTPRQFNKYLANKGAVAIDGISLTPHNVTGGTFTATIVPHTFNNTTLQFKRGGSIVNVEYDILAKYLRNFFENGNTPS